jgi:hypothetical protein
VIFSSTPVPYHADWTTRDRGQPIEVLHSPSVLLSEDSQNSLTLIHGFLEIRQTYWCLCLTDVWHESLYFMEGIEKPHTDKHKEITNDWNYVARRTLPSVPVWDFENFRRLIFVVQSVHADRLGKRRGVRTRTPPECESRITAVPTHSVAEEGRLRVEMIMYSIL